MTDEEIPFPQQTSLPESGAAQADGAITAVQLRILLEQAEMLPRDLRPSYDQLGAALARGLPSHSFRRAAVNLRRHLESSA